MISSERTQNIIVSFVIITAVVSSILLVSNAQYYSGSYLLAGKMEVNLLRSTVDNIDPSNASIYPSISFTFNFRTDSPIDGNVRLGYIRATLWLNEDLLSLTPLSRFLNNEYVHPGYDSNFTLGTTLDSDPDRTAILDAYSADTWNWYIRLRYSIISFDEERSTVTRTLYFNWTGSTV
jgi:hypothetical protein